MVAQTLKLVKAKEASTPLVDNVKPEKKPNVVNQMVLTKSPKPIVAKPNTRGKSLPKRQRGPQTQHYCHHFGVLGHTKPNYYELQALKNADLQKPRRQGKDNGKTQATKRARRRTHYE